MFSSTFVVEGKPSLEDYKGLFTQRNIFFFLNSLLLASLSTLLASLIGIFLGFLLGKTDIPLKWVLRPLLLLPFIIPSYIYGLAWANLLGKTGPLNNMLSYLPFITSEGISHFIYSPFGAATVLGLSLFPVIMMVAESSFVGVEAHLEEMGLLLGSRRRTVKEILFPLALPGIISGMIVVFILALSDFGVPFLLGVKVLPTQIFTEFSVFYNEKMATTLCLPLALFTVLIITLERVFLGARPLEGLVRGTRGRTYLYTLGKGKVPYFVACVLIFCLSVFSPLISLIVDSWSLEAYKRAFSLAKLGIVNTLVFSAVGATLLTLLGLILGYFLEKYRLPSTRELGFSLMLLFAVPATVIGVGLIKLWNRPEVFFQWIYGTFAIIIIGYIARFSPLSVRFLADGYRQVSSSISEAAEVYGAGWWTLMVKIFFPLLIPGIVTTWILSFIFCAGELGTTILIYPPGDETLPITLFTVMANSPANVVSAISVILLVVVLLPLIVFLGLSRRLGRWRY
ncbi:MAG TPA: ABC transporter permease [Candidatus Hypogeohydataceae bacterium YC41]